MPRKIPHYQLTRSKIRVPRWLAIISGIAGSVLGVATNLYSAEFRNAISSASHAFTGTVISIVVAAVAASTVTLVTFYWLVKHQQQRTEILPGQIPITADVLRLVDDEQDSVVGRTLHFLEARRSSPELVVFLHGLGLDANDFRPYMTESKYHCVALTLFGFNVSEATDDHYKPISLPTHVQLVAYMLTTLRELYPQKRLTLVGFSLGADAFLLLPRYAPKTTHELKINRVVLLDPNINRATTTLSARVAAVQPATPLTELLKILEGADNIAEFRILCEYLHKITSKNFAQVQRHARDIVAIWDTDSADRFLDRLGQLTASVEEVDVVVSYDYERHFNAIGRGAVERGLRLGGLESSRHGHFDLIAAQSLRERLSSLPQPH
jgi:pimeloyl-ACP methyl ester carboxylesterase